MGGGESNINNNDKDLYRNKISKANIIFILAFIVIIDIKDKNNEETA